MAISPFIVQGIVTKYMGPTNTRGSRIKARAWAGSVTVPYVSGLSIEQNHRDAAEALARKYEWTGQMAQGGSPDERGYLFVFT